MWIDEFFQWYLKNEYQILEQKEKLLNEGSSQYEDLP